MSPLPSLDGDQKSSQMCHKNVQPQGPRYLRHLGKLTSLRLGLEMLKAGNSVKKLVWRLFLVSSWCGQNPGPGEKTSFLLQQPPPTHHCLKQHLCALRFILHCHYALSSCIISTLTYTIISIICLIMRFPSKKKRKFINRKSSNCSYFMRL